MFFFQFDERGRVQIPLLAGHYKMTFCWQVDNGLTLNAGLVAL